MVEIVWLDAHVTTDSTTIRKAAKIKPIRTKTLGYLIAENDDGVVIASDTYEKNPKEGGIVNFIPWGMVAEYWELVEDGQKTQK